MGRGIISGGEVVFFTPTFRHDGTPVSCVEFIGEKNLVFTSYFLLIFELNFWSVRSRRSVFTGVSR